jgi:hypothetical protein
VAWTYAQGGECVREPIGESAELGIRRLAVLAVLPFPDHGHRLGGAFGPKVDALVGQVDRALREPGRPLRSPRTIDDVDVGIDELDPEVLHHRVPEPADVGHGAGAQLRERVDAVRAHQPRDVRALDVVPGGGPYDVHGFTV